MSLMPPRYVYYFRCFRCFRYILLASPYYAPRVTEAVADCHADYGDTAALLLMLFATMLTPLCFDAMPYFSPPMLLSHAVTIC